MTIDDIADGIAAYAVSRGGALKDGKTPDEMNTADFIRESLGIEGIKREPTPEEIKAHNHFMCLSKIKVFDLEHFVKVFHPDAVLRNKKGLDVKIGGYLPPKGGWFIETQLQIVLENIADKNITPYEAHCMFEDLQPFTDCNGRAGRMLWLWMMREAPLGFLHTFYYQALEHGRKR